MLNYWKYNAGMLMIKPILPDGPTPFSLRAVRLPNLNPVRIQSEANRVCFCQGKLQIGNVGNSCRAKCSVCGHYFDIYGRNEGDLRSEKILEGLSMTTTRPFSWIPSWMKLFPEPVVWKLADTGLFFGDFYQVFSVFKKKVEEDGSDFVLEGREVRMSADFRKSCWVFPLEVCPGFLCGMLVYLNDGQVLRVHVRGKSNPLGARCSRSDDPYCVFRYSPGGFQLSLLEWGELFETCFDELSGFSLDRGVVLRIKEMNPRIVNFRLNKP